ncbi:M4 family metallopeptidase [Archangium violaceum]|uniref:M4 family metallopeptidase n=1 Tax=Archangium violaceum TaxID=83451 RepID=UPI0036DCCF56
MSSLAAGAQHDEVHAVLNALAPSFRLVPRELSLHRVTVDEWGHQHLRFRQQKDGREVIGSELLLHVDAEGNVYAANGSARGDLEAPRRVLFPLEAAVRVALGDARSLRVTASRDPRLVYLRTETPDGLRLAHEIPVEGVRAGLPVDELVYISAEDGLLLATHSRIHTVLDRAISSAENGISVPGVFRRGEGQPATEDSHVDLQYEHLKTTYDCYQQNFRRDSYDGAGAQLKSTVHYDVGHVNAFWNGTRMIFGDGDGVLSGPLGEDLDVTVHELTHAVTGSESGLFYTNESGALNESLSDIAAAFCASWTRRWEMDAEVWWMADHIWTPATKGDAMRYMDDPTRDGTSRDYFPERYVGTDDNGGVHWNSGIPNLAFKLLATGGTHPRAKSSQQVDGIGIEKAGRIFYRAATILFTPATDFLQAKTYTEQAAAELYGAGSAEKASVTQAWLAVGVGGLGSPTTPVAELVSGKPLDGLKDDTAGGTRYYSLQVPAGVSHLFFETSGGDGDVDLHVQRSEQPTLGTYDCRPYQSGNDESCSFHEPAEGTWYVMLRGYSAYSGVRLEGRYVLKEDATELRDGVPLKPLSGAEDSQRHWRMDVPAGKGLLSITLRNGVGDADLYVKFGAAPSLTDYDCRPYSAEQEERCPFSQPAEGPWHVIVVGYGTYSNATLEAVLSPATALP